MNASTTLQQRLAAERQQFNRLVSAAGAGNLMHLQICCDKARKAKRGRAVEIAQSAIIDFVRRNKASKRPISSDEFATLSMTFYYLDLSETTASREWHTASGAFDFVVLNCMEA